MSQYEILVLDFIFRQQRTVGCAKYVLPFLKAVLESRSFIDKPGNLSDHPAERFTDHLKSKRHFDQCEKQIMSQQSLEA